MLNRLYVLVARRAPAWCLSPPLHTTLKRAALVGRTGRIPCFYRELVPSVVAVLRGWSATLIVVPSYRQPLAADHALWAAITAPLPPARS
jgi:hypothetical protein